MSIHSHILAGAGKTIMLALLWTIVTIVPAWAQSTTWPTNNEFVGYTYSNSSAVQDPNDIPNNQIEFDLIYDPTLSPYTVQIAVDNSYVFFRLQVRNITSWTVGTYLIFVADASGTILGKTYLTLTGNAGEIHVINASGTTDMTTGSGSHSTNIGGWARFGSISGTTYEYVDFQIPQSTFENTLGITAASQIRFYAGTSTGGGNINNINTDWMTPSTNGTPTATDFSTLSLASLFSINLGALPVELTSFTAHVKEQTTLLRWRTATELNNFGFEIERSTEGSAWEMIGFVPGAGTSSSPRSYDHADRDLPSAGTIRYRLRQVDRDGSFEYSPIVQVHHGPSSAVGISGSFPSPARSRTTVNYTVATPGSMSLTLHDLAGREVMRVADSNVEAGAYSAMLDVQALPRGMYFLHMRQSGTTHVHPLLVTD